MTTLDLITQLRTLHGYTRLDAERAVRDTLDVLRHLLDEMSVGDDLQLAGVGRFTCIVEIHKDGGNGQAIAWRPCRQLADGHKLRALPTNDSRVILARSRRPKW